MHPLAQPFSREPKPELTDDRSIGVLLLHGFSGSPASMRPWANHLAGRGYAVEVPLLPGHGTRWQDLNQVRWTDWYAEAEAALDRLLATCDAVVVGALSMGGSVALRLAEERGDRRGRAGAGQPVRLERPQGAARAPGPQARRPLAQGRGQRHQEARRGRGRLPPAAAEGARRGRGDVEGGRARPAEGHPAAALLPLPRGPRHRRLLQPDRAAARSARATARSGC